MFTGGERSSEANSDWDGTNFSRFLFYLTSNRAVHSWGLGGAAGSQRIQKDSSTPSFNVREGSSRTKLGRHVSRFPAPLGSLKLEQRCGEGTRGEMTEGLLSPQWSCLDMMEQQSPIWEDLFISCHGNNRTMTQPPSPLSPTTFSLTWDSLIPF